MFSNSCFFFLHSTITTVSIFDFEVSESEGFKKLLKDQLIVITNDIEEE